jgi:predicted acylesterase/phospholipase RssA
MKLSLILSWLKWLFSIKVLAVVFAASAVLLFEVLVGKGHRLSDTACALAAALVTFAFRPVYRKLFKAKGRPRPEDRAKSSRWRPVKLAFAFLLLAWVFISAADIWLRPSYTFRPRSAAPPGSDAGRLPARVAVALSGGGYRAALFHAGVLSELDRLGVRVQAVSSVSGGSIIGSFYAVGGQPSDFLAVVKDGRFNLKREFLNFFNVWRFSRSEVQANMLDRVFLGGVRHAETSRSGLPELMVCTTDVAAAEMIGITPRGVVKQAIAPAAARSSFVNPANAGLGSSPPPWFDEDPHAGLPDGRRLAELVAASGAFPAAINPLRVEKRYAVSDDPADVKTYVLSDGGVGDNLGSVLAYAANNAAQFAAKSRAGGGKGGGAEMAAVNWQLDNWLFDLLIVSDGSAISSNAPPSSALSEIGSAIDSMYAATGGDQMRGTLDPGLKPPPAILISPLTLVRTRNPKALAAGSTEPLVNLHFGTELVLSPSAPGGPPASITFTGIEPEALGFIVEHMPDDERARAAAAIEQLKQSGTLQGGEWHQSDWKAGGPARTLYDLVRRELDRRARAFLNTSTLDDQLNAGMAESIFLLGQYVVRLNKPYILRYAGAVAGPHSN